MQPSTRTAMHLQPLLTISLLGLAATIGAQFGFFGFPVLAHFYLRRASVSRQFKGGGARHGEVGRSAS